MIEPAPAPVRGIPHKPSTSDDLTAVTGTPGVRRPPRRERDQLVRQLASADPEQVATAAGVRPDAVADWIAQAERLISD